MRKWTVLCEGACAGFDVCTCEGACACAGVGLCRGGPAPSPSSALMIDCAGVGVDVIACFGKLLPPSSHTLIN